MKKPEYKNQLTATFWAGDDELRGVKVGQKLIVTDVTYEGPNEENNPHHWELWEDNGKGVRRDFGYSDNYEYHGWLGTWQSWNRHGYGLRRVLDIEEFEDRWGNTKVRVRFGRDLVPDRW